MKKDKIGRIVTIVVALVIIFEVVVNVDFGSIFKNVTSELNDEFSQEETSEVLEVDGELNVYFIDVGQADCIYVNQGDYNMLIDAGNNEDGERLVSYFNSLNITEFNYVIGTHPHEDHIGGMDDVINNFTIDNYYMPDKLSTSKTFEDVLDALESNNLTYHVPEKGEQFNLGDALVTVIYAGDDTSDTNDSSIVLKLTYGEVNFLFTGDATSNVEEQIISDDISSDVLKVAHHGSNYSSSDDFLDAVSPDYAVISVGENNSYNHPSESTLEKLSSRNIKVYRTDQDGTIIFTTDGSTISVSTTSTDTNG